MFNIELTLIRIRFERKGTCKIRLNTSPTLADLMAAKQEI